MVKIRLVEVKLVIIVKKWEKVCLIVFCFVLKFIYSVRGSGSLYICNVVVIGMVIYISIVVCCFNIE